MLISAFRDTVDDIRNDVARMPLTSWSESVFRFMYSQALARRDGTIKQFFECQKIDLVLHRKSERAFVEFKFYAHSTAYNALSGAKCGMKGGPSPKNYRGFSKSIEIIRRHSAPHKAPRLVALFYSDPANTTGRTFDSYYGDRSAVERKLNLRRLVSIPLFCRNDKRTVSNCYGKLYEVRI